MDHDPWTQYLNAEGPDHYGALRQRVKLHALKYGGADYAASLGLPFETATEEQLHRALERWTPDTITEALSKDIKPYTKIKEADIERTSEA